MRTPPMKININKEDTYIDHIYTNHPKKIHGQLIIRNGYSDHYIIKFYRKTKNPKNHPSYFISGDYSKINWDLVRQGISDDINIKNASLSHSSQEISHLIIQSITEHLEVQAPLTRKQNSKKYLDLLLRLQNLQLKKEI